jgi:hypothetical protein
MLMRVLLVPVSAGELGGDRRAAIKPQINMVLGSGVVEKSHGVR